MTLVGMDADDARNIASLAVTGLVFRNEYISEKRDRTACES